MSSTEKRNIAGTSGEGSGSSGLPVLPVLLPLKNTKVQYRIGKLPALHPVLLPLNRGKDPIPKELSGTTAATSGQRI